MPDRSAAAAAPAAPRGARRPVLANWYAETVNFGDLVTPFLIRRLAGREPLNLLHVHRGIDPRRQTPLRRATWAAWAQRLRRVRRPEYVLVGSILGWRAWTGDVQVVWGAGFMDAAATLRNRPRRIHAVRGERTLARLPPAWRAEVAALGDPGVLVADMVADAPAPVPGRIGFVAHYTHKREPLLAALAADPAVSVIDVQQEVVPFMRQLAACEVVVASAMHALIAADGLGRPNRWVALPGTPLPAGGQFKFADYFSVAGRPQAAPDLVATPTDVVAAAGRAIGRDVAAMKAALRAACPLGSA